MCHSESVIQANLQIALWLSVLALAGCSERSGANRERRTAEEPGETAAAQDAEAPQYSPFWVHTVAPALPFNAITFKDVGMSLPVEDRAFIYESLAETLARDLREHAIESHVSHSAALTDPSNHMSCESEHVYVDVWQSGGGYGYSLWSGCGEEDQFAHGEFEGSAEDLGHSPEQLAVLSISIVRDLRHAVATGCFTRVC